MIIIIPVVEVAPAFALTQHDRPSKFSAELTESTSVEVPLPHLVGAVFVETVGTGQL